MNSLKFETKNELIGEFRILKSAFYRKLKKYFDCRNVNMSRNHILQPTKIVSL